MVGLWAAGSAPNTLTLHIAFATSLDAVLDAPERLRRLGVTPLSFYAEETNEPSVIGWMPAAATYFRDPDGHMLEYLAMLDGPARPELGIRPWSQSGLDAAAMPIRIEPYRGSREALRPLFALAEDSSAELDGYLDAGDVLVAREGERVVGHVQVVDDGDGFELKSLAVVPERRRHGTGRRLVEAAIALAGDRPVRVATAAADVDNLRFYQRLGFRLRSVERDAFTAERGYGPGLQSDGIVLRDRVWLDLDPRA